MNGSREMVANSVDLGVTDPEVYNLINQEKERQRSCLQMIASENIASSAVMQAQGSIMTNKYAEGYPKKRYYQGCYIHDEVERLAINRLCNIFGCNYANVQPHSGSQANQAVFLALLEPYDTVLGLSLNSGGHLTHGALPNLSGKWFKAIHYDVDPKTHLIDLNQIENLAQKHKPKLIIAGASAYSRHIDFAAIKRIASESKAIFLADIAHYSGLIAGKCYPSPFPHADIVTSTTHKTLRGPRGGIIMSNDENIMKKINSAIFPGLQGGAMMNTIAAKAVAFLEASTPEFKNYCKRVIENAQVLAKTLINGSISVLTGGTDSHMVLIDLRPQGLTGKQVALDLELAKITCNKNAIPFDPLGPFTTSGIRLGTAFETTRGLNKSDFIEIGTIIKDLITQNKTTESAGHRVSELLSRFHQPIL